MTIQERAAKVLQEIDADLALAEKATPGSWRWEQCAYVHQRDGQIIYSGDDDAAFIAASRTGWPTALRCLKVAIEGMLRIQSIDLSPCDGGSCMVATDASDIADANNNAVVAALTTLCDQWEARK